MDFPSRRQKSGDGKERYAYMFKSGSRRFLFIRHFGSGVESVAQLVEDLDTGETLIRKVTASRLQQQHTVGEDPRLKKPNEIRILDAIRDSFRAPDPRYPPYIAECYGHDYIKSKDTGSTGWPKYSSVSYWKLYNGGSVTERWLTGEITPPLMAVARMIHQVLSTLQYLCTAGKKPIYHGDIHLGNVWVHWKADTLLPDFYLGDFEDARFADSKYKPLPLQDNAMIGAPVSDLYDFWQSLDSLVTIATTNRDDVGSRVLKNIIGSIHNAMVLWREGPHTLTPPDLTEPITISRHLEDICGQGGVADETQSEDYIKYITKVRAEALKVESEKARVVQATKHDALWPRIPGRLASIPIAIHGPWHLVRVDWIQVERDGVTHHRPKGARAAANTKDLAKSKKPRVTNLPTWFDTDGNISSTTTSPSLFSGSDTSAGSQPEPSFSEFLNAISDSGGEMNDEDVEFCPTLSETSGDPDRFGARSRYKTGEVEMNAPGTYTEQSDSRFDRDERNRAQARAYEIPLFPTSASDNPSSIGLNHAAKRGANRSPQSQAKLDEWHARLHGGDCQCDREVWWEDLDAMLKDKNRKKIRKRLRNLNAFNFCKPWNPEG